VFQNNIKLFSVDLAFRRSFFVIKYNAEI